jgi:hypothetical protein
MYSYKILQLCINKLRSFMFSSTADDFFSNVVLMPLNIEEAIKKTFLNR